MICCSKFCGLLLEGADVSGGAEAGLLPCLLAEEFG